MAEPHDPNVEPLSDGERAELDRLRTEVQTLRERRPKRRIAWKSIAAGFLLVLGCLLTPVSLATVWVHNQVANTDRFVATMSPLISQPSVQAAVTNRVTDTVFTYVDVQGLANDAISALATQGVPPGVTDRLRGLTGPLSSSVQGFVHGEVAKVVAGPGVSQLWDQSIRIASEQMNAVLSGQSSAVVVSGGDVKLDLAPFINAAKQQLASSGLGLANRIPSVHPTITITNASSLERAKSAYSLLDTGATWLPWVTLVFFAAGIYLARDHRRALVGTGLGVAVAMVVLAAGLYITRGVVIGAVPQQSAAAAGDSYNVVVRFLRDGLRTLFAVGIVVALGAFLAGPSKTAVAIRTGLSRGIAWLRRGGARAGLRTGPVGPWVYAYRTPLRVALVAVAALVFVFFAQPSGLTVLIIVLVLLVCLGIVQFLAQPPAEQREQEH
ncbi:hypothetical protein ABZ863_19465 [Saccharomonospora sp. NPDC046836]|uniref:hypothetical protein n=1 Tax=Saccharomonospora sp. NPDC046836 TaxID=3156921 RepID=UPI0033C5A7C8